MRKKWQKIGGNEVDSATTTNNKWGFKPVPGKGGKTLNSIIIPKKEDK